jgi:eukaryotic-like serine/threonine-protein kinase
MRSIVNPYLHRLAVDDPRHFHGRKRELVQIVEAITDEGNSRLTLWGAPRIGKSSLLRRICAESGDVKEQISTVYLDLYRLRDTSLEGFLELMQSVLSPDPGGTQSRTEPVDTVFERILAEFSGSGRRLVLLLDQFDSLDRDPSFKKFLAAYLHSLTREHRLCWVTASSPGNRRLPRLPQAGDSVFVNSAAWLRAFSRQEARELISIPSEQAGRPLEQFADRIVEMAGLSPFFLQIACSAFFDRLLEPADTGLPDIREAFQEEAEPHFDSLVETLGPDSLPVLKELAASGKASMDRVAEHCLLLRWAGLVIPEGEHALVAPSMFQTYLRDHLGTRSSFMPLGDCGPEPAKPGKVVRQYRLSAPVGITGQVYRAKLLTGGRPVALKIVKPDRLQGAAFLKTSIEEIQRVAAVSHDAIAAVLDVFEHHGNLVVVSEWLEGETLREKIVREGRLHRARLLRWMADACTGLLAAARQGLIHRHIKPSNLMVTSRGQLKILDFGLLDHPLQAPQSCSPRAHPDAMYYLSPEQASGQQPDARSDLFALGVVLFEGLTGRLPFRRSSVSSTLQAILNDPVPDLASFQVESAEVIQPVLSRLLQKHPSRRYQTAAEAERELRKLLGQSRRRLFSRR